MNRKYKIFGMTFILLVTLSSITAMAASASRAPNQHTSAPVTTHPSQGPVTVIDGATARMHSNDDGIVVIMATKQLDKMHADTLWVITINRPDLCLTSPCTPEDILKRTDIVDANVVYGGGRVVRGNITSFMSYLPVGEVDGGWFDNDFVNPRGAEVHLVVNDHGPLIPELAREMTSTYRAGCTDASIPTAFPPTAYADGTPGPNQCRLVQVAIFQQ